MQKLLIARPAFEDPGPGRSPVFGKARSGASLRTATAAAGPEGSTSRSGPVARAKGDRGSAILEFTGFLPLLLLIGMAVIQLGLVGYSYSQAGSAARAGARSAAQGASAELSAKAAMSDWLADKTDIDTPGMGDTVTVKATVEIPTLVPFADFGWEAEREVTMPADD
ncbi:TadE-like protein [Streptomyces sp. YIM 130001]|uniref:TadE family protein n=1 Tax=Streptomyces sp. YIM 130001 TaxID=2259644 RepID=UPI000E65989A|nr:TadE family protein [Streptomyces sp. YIM 130001]RII20703.1 TadE-like protein [Streptomyces sp. YIM 130001]